MTDATYTLEIVRGQANAWTFGLGQSGQYRYAAISAATQAAPCVLTAASHGVPEGWVYTVEGARGMTALNRPEYSLAKVLDPDRLEINDLNTTNAPPYSGGGVIRYEVPMDLSDVVAARAQLRAGVGVAAALLTLTLEPGEGLSLDVQRSAVELEVSEAQATALAVESGVWDLELLTAAGAVIKPLRLSRFVVLPEATA